MNFRPETAFVCGPDLPWRPGITTSKVGHPAHKSVWKPGARASDPIIYRCPHCGYTWTEELDG